MSSPRNKVQEFHNLNILFIDDDAAFSRTIAMMLHEGYGHNTKIAASAFQAYAEIQRSNFDVILLDYRLEDASGLDVLQWMLDHSIDTPVILLTGFGCEEVAVEAMKLGAYDYVNKGHISFDYIPELIHRTKERHLVVKQQRQRNTAIQAFQNAVHSSLFLIGQSVANIHSRLETHQDPLADGNVPSEPVDETLRAVAHEMRLIRETIASLNDLNDLLSQERSGEQVKPSHHES
ncbi:MAG: response regulator [Bacteroidota bacterium]